ncbi:MAG: peptidoglycan-binding protein [Alphaproteobacteria bacterium]|nr:peptidoglycan-binding protein [Alphaproteobacteria bacterium]
MVFKLNRMLSESSSAHPEDVLNTKTALTRLGFYQPPEWGITDFPDRAMFNGVREFQNANGLKVDGVMKQGGPTENAFQQLAQRMQDKPLLQIDPNAQGGIRVSPLQDRGEGKTPSTPTLKEGTNQQPCPHMQKQVKSKVCLPYTNMCYDDVKCESFPAGGKRW